MKKIFAVLCVLTVLCNTCYVLAEQHGETAGFCSERVNDMGYIKNLQGYPLYDAQAHEKIDALSQEVQAIKKPTKEEAFQVTGKVVVCEPKKDTPLTVISSGTVGLYSMGMNMFCASPGNTGTKEKNGVTFTFEDDGSVTLNGTCTADMWPVLYSSTGATIETHTKDFAASNALRLPESSYIFTHYLTGIATNNAYPGPQLSYYKPNFSLSGGGAEAGSLIIDAGNIYGVNSIYLICPKGATYTNFNVRWQFMVGKTKVDYRKPVPRRWHNTSGEVQISGLDDYTIIPDSAVNITVKGVKEVPVEENDSVKFDPVGYGLPILYLNGDTTDMTKDYAVDLLYTYKDYTGTASVKWQGSSSIYYPKKNYTIKFDQAFEAKEGWGAQKKYCLKANFIDFSHARNVCGAKLWGEIVATRTNIPEKLASAPNYGAVDGFPIVVVLNDEFHGLYTFNIPKDAWMFGMGDGEREAIICANETSDATGFKTPALVDGSHFDLEYAPDEDNAGWVQESLNRLINACINSDGTDLDTTIAQYLDWESAIDYYIFLVLTTGHDMIRRNYLLSTYDGTKWFFTAYDMDSTFGLHYTGEKWLRPDYNPAFYSLAQEHRVFELIYTYKKEELKARYQQLRKTEAVMSDENVACTFANFIAPIHATLFAEDAKKWPSIPNTYVNNVNQIWEFYRLRVKNTDRWANNL